MPKSAAVHPPSTRRRAAVAALVSASALLASSPGASAAGWAPGPAFTPPPQTFSVDVAAAPDGAATAVWVTPDAAMLRGVVQAQRVSPTGVAGPVRTLGDADPESVTDVAVSADGDTVVAWTGAAESGDPLPLRVAALAADGSPGPVRSIDAGVASDPFDSLGAAVDDAGNTTVVWFGREVGGVEQGVNTVRFPAAGPAEQPLLLSRTGDAAAPAVAVTPAGVAWVAWTDDDAFSTAAWVGRLGADGQPDGAPVQASAGEVSGIGIAAGAAGAAIAWTEGDGSSPGRVAGVRLPLDGDVLGAPVETASDAAAQGGASAPAIAPDGTISVAWARPTGASGPTPGSEIVLSRFAPGAATAATAPLAAAGGIAAAYPQLGGAPDGSLLVTWVQYESGLSFSFHGLRVAPDGTPSAAARARDVPVTLFPIDPTRPFLQTYLPQADTLGGGVLGVVAGLPIPAAVVPESLSAFVFDAVAPVVTLDVPASAPVGTPVAFSATATDRVGVELTWDFGDESQSRSRTPRHRYAEAGAYTVTLTATDAAGNQTVLKRQLTVTAPPAPPAPRPRPQARAAAALKLVQASRTGAKATVAGTISRRASGRVSIVYARWSGGRTVTARTTARIANGRWSTTLRLRRVLARASRWNARVIVSYAGDADTRKGSARGVVGVRR